MFGLKRALVFAGLLIIVNSIFGQIGAPLLSHFKEGRDLEDQNLAICQDDYDVMLFANRRGIMTFDGQEKKLIRIPAIPYTISFNKNEKKVFVGGQNNYGYLSRNELGEYKYYSLSDDSSYVGLITRILYTDSTVYFYSDQTISRHNIKSGKLELRLTQKDNNLFTGMFITPKNTFINVMSKGLFRLESDTLFPIVTGYMTEKEEILFSLPYDKKLVLLGISNTGSGSLYLFDGIKYYDFQIKDNGYLKENILTDGISISDSLYAFSTLDGGAMVVERKSGKPRFTVNLDNGLPDDEVLAMGIDNNNGLWLSHQYGLTRAELFLPVSNYNFYPGLKGNLINSLWFNNELFVATSEGVFYLTEDIRSSQYEILVRIPSADTVPVVSLVQDIVPGKVGQEAPKQRRSLLSRIFGKKNSGQQIQETPALENRGNEVVRPEVSRPATPRYERQKVTRVVSGGFIYKKIEGLGEKSRQMIPTENGILVSTNKGLFVISGHVARPVVKDRYIYFISNRSSDNKYYAAASDGYFSISFRNGVWAPDYPDNNFQQPLYSIIVTSDNSIWAGSDNVAYKFSPAAGNSPQKYLQYSIKNEYPQRYLLDWVNDTVFLFTESGVRFFDVGSDSLRLYKHDLRRNGKGIEYVISQPDAPWIKRGEDWLFLNQKSGVEANDRALLKIFDDVVSIGTDENNLWVIDGKNQLFRIRRNQISSLKPDLDLFVRSIRNEQGISFEIGDIVFGRGDNTVTFDIIAPWYLKQNSTLYQYAVDKMMDGWSSWSPNTTITLFAAQPGTYTLQVRAKDIWGNISSTKSLKFTIKAPFFQTSLFFILVTGFALCIIVIIVRFRERQLKKDKHILEEKVRERTAEIEAQKQEITSSIEYASRIQMAMLPMDEHFRNAFTDYFVIFKPRDIVSGDFYWMGEDENHIFFTVADCTGHGVPGAFMSTLGISTLNEIITNKKDLHANTVLNLLREKIKTSLHQTGKEGEAADGMDISFCVLDKSRKMVEFAGAYNPLFIFQNGEIKEYKADRMPIGIYIGEKESFTNFEINITKGDTIYILSDGYSDQFGGPEGTKYKKANLRKLLTEIYQKPLPEQKQIIENEFEKWRGRNEQVDDITIIGVRI